MSTPMRPRRSARTRRPVGTPTPGGLDQLEPGEQPSDTGPQSRVGADGENDDAVGSGRGGATPPPSGRPRREIRPPRRWPWVLGLVLVFGLLAGGFATLWWTSVLGLRTVQVTGVQADVQAEVQAAVDVAPGTPLARIDLDAVTARVAALPVVESVQVTRGWPHALDVQVIAREAVAVTQANGSWWLMDAAGDPYVTVAAPPAGLPVVELATPGAGDSATAAALQVAAALPDTLRAQVAAVTARTAFDVRLRLTDGRTVVWGDAGDATLTARKLQVLPALLQQEGTVLDVSDPTLVSVR